MNPPENGNIVKNGNGVKAVWVRLIEMLIMSAIVGGLTMWGNSRVMETKLVNLCDQVGEVKTSIKTLSDITATTRMEIVRHDTMINLLIGKMDDRSRHDLRKMQEMNK